MGTSYKAVVQFQQHWDPVMGRDPNAALEDNQG